MAICFSTGFCAGWRISKLDAVSVLKRVKGLDGIELMFYSPTEFWDFLDDFSDYGFLKSLSENSIHLPVKDICYADSHKTRALLESVQSLCNKIRVKRVVLHSNLVVDWDIFNSFDMFFLVENLSPGKDKAVVQKPNQLQAFLELHPSFGFCLDTCHAMSTSTLPTDFLIVKKKIAQIHASSAKGFGLEQIHTPLFQTNQKNLEYIKPVLGLTVPLVIESIMPLNKPALLQKEIDFVKGLSNAR